MTVTAMSLINVEIGAMRATVTHVLACGSPREIVRAVVQRITIQMARHGTLPRLPVKRPRDRAMYENGTFTPEIVDQINVSIGDAGRGSSNPCSSDASGD